MTREREPRHGEGTAWLVADRLRGGFLCYSYTRPAGDRLAESTRVADALEALAWGRLRTPRVRIRTADGHAHWAGTATRPAGIADSWSEPDPAASPIPH